VGRPPGSLSKASEPRGVSRDAMEVVERVGYHPLEELLRLLKSEHDRWKAKGTRKHCMPKDTLAKLHLEACKLLYPQLKQTDVNSSQSVERSVTVNVVTGVPRGPELDVTPADDDGQPALQAPSVGDRASPEPGSSGGGSRYYSASARGKDARADRGAGGSGGSVSADAGAGSTGSAD